jgi:hypothetical protein
MSERGVEEHDDRAEQVRRPVRKEAAGTAAAAGSLGAPRAAAQLALHAHNVLLQRSMPHAWHTATHLSAFYKPRRRCTYIEDSIGYDLAVETS